MLWFGHIVKLSHYLNPAWVDGVHSIARKLVLHVDMGS
jgi:hypothetical protein